MIELPREIYTILLLCAGVAFGVLCMELLWIARHRRRRAKEDALIAHQEHLAQDLEDKINTWKAKQAANVVNLPRRDFDHEA